MILAIVGGYDPAYPRNHVLRTGLLRLGVTVHALFVPRRAGVIGRAAAIVGAVGRLDPSPDVVLVPEFCHKDVPAAWAAARRARAVLAADPLISRVDTLVGEWGLYRPGSLDAWACRKWDDVAFRWPAVVVADTEVHARRFAGAADRTPLPVVYVGADDAFFDLPDEEPPASPMTVLYVGGFLPLHGLETILLAAERLAARGIEDVVFDLIGDGIRHSAMKALAAERGLKNVRFLGRRPLEDLPAHMARAHVVLGIFGTAGEAGRVIPNKVSQGLAAGRCVVTADTEAARELLTHGTDAVLVPAGDADALADRLRSLRDDRLLRARIAAAGRSLARRALTPEAVARQLLVALGARKIAQGDPALRAARAAVAVPSGALGVPNAPIAPAGA
jgi:glycosyltransferase involved in cell wall biosynthesis